MIHTIQILRDMERNLSNLLGAGEPDFDDLQHTMSDEWLEEMADQYARSHYAINTTPVL